MPVITSAHLYSSASHVRRSLSLLMPCIPPTRKSMSAMPKNQNFHYFLVLDFEATCDQGRKMVPQEIIEFPVIKLNAKTLEEGAQFHSYVQPKVNRELTSFCTELTGIIQDMVDGQPPIEKVLSDFDSWLHDQVLRENETFAFVTCGEWDLATMLPQQCEYLNISVPAYFKKWINLKKAFTEHVGRYPKHGMMSMLEELGIQHIGRHHSGIDDCKNISNIVKTLVNQGYVFNITSHSRK